MYTLEILHAVRDVGWRALAYARAKKLNVNVDVTMDGERRNNVR